MLRMRSAVFRAFLLAFASLLLVSCAQPGVHGPQAASVQGLPDYRVWPHDTSDLAPDPGVRYGVLPNGVRYALMRSTQPAKAISIRMRFASGSVQEQDDQRGLAHFLEHMAFNGSRNVPEGEFVKLLQRHGLAFGAHTNAYTSSDETVYMLELPKNDDELIGIGLMLMREVAGNLTIDAAAVERERGVVLSEQRSRNTPEYRSYERLWRASWEGQRLADRMPIGTIATIKAATRDLIASYYEAYYRPERTLLVVAGDFDPVKMEGAIRARFGDWRGKGEDPVDPDLGKPEQRGLTAIVYTEKNLPESVSASWFSPPLNRTDTAQNRLEDLKLELALAVINRRFSKIARGENAPFLSAGVGQSETRYASREFSLSVSSRPGRWKIAMSAAEQELRRALQFGFAKSEVDREVKEWLSGLEDAAATAATRQSAQLASGIINAFSARSVFTHPDSTLARFKAIAGQLTADVALASLREAVRGSGPLVFLSTGESVSGGDAALAQAWTASTKVAVAPPQVQEAKVFPYVSFGEPGRIAMQSDVPDLGMSLYAFQNGVRLNVKQTSFEKDTIYVSVRFDGGFLSMPLSKKGLYWVLPYGFSEGGLKRLTTDELEAALAGRIVSADLDIEESSFTMSGATNQKDLLLQMQLLAAYASEPAWRGEGLSRLQGAAESYIRQYASSPSRVLAREAPAMLRSGDPRWAFPSLGELRLLTMADIRQVLEPALSRAPVEISIVGDIEPEAAARTVASTFGALPPRDRAVLELLAGGTMKFPAGGERKLVHEGKQEEAAAYAAWPAPDFYSNPRRARALTLLKEIVKVRLTEEFREAQGATYSPSASSYYATAFTGFGFVTASAETRPELVAGFFKTLDDVVGELQSGAFGDDVLLRARRPLVESIEKSRLTNGYWVGVVGQAQSRPESLEAARSQLPDYREIKRDELIAVAREWLARGRRLDVQVLPAPKIAGASRGSEVSAKVGP